MISPPTLCRRTVIPQQANDTKLTEKLNRNGLRQQNDPTWPNQRLALRKILIYEPFMLNRRVN